MPGRPPAAWHHRPAYSASYSPCGWPLAAAAWRCAMMQSRWSAQALRPRLGQSVRESLRGWWASPALAPATRTEAAAAAPGPTHGTGQPERAAALPLRRASERERARRWTASPASTPTTWTRPLWRPSGATRRTTAAPRPRSCGPCRATRAWSCTRRALRRATAAGPPACRVGLK
jgi:hypothetical protein